MTYKNALRCLSDPTRRAVFERLRAGPQSVGVLAQGLPVSRPAVSQHLKALKDAGLVNDRPEGARHVYFIDPLGLGDLRRWLDQFWDDTLAAFQQEVAATDTKPAAVRDTAQEDTLNRSISIAPVRKTVLVQATPARAFDVFTAGIDRWWPKTHTIGPAPILESVIEPFVGGRWYSTCDDGTVVTVGHVRTWRPGERFTVSWEISARWQPDPRPQLTSEVDVTFTAEGEDRTRVDLEHRHFERMGGEDGEKMRTDVNGGWPTMLELYAAAVAAA